MRGRFDRLSFPLGFRVLGMIVTVSGTVWALALRSKSWLCSRSLPSYPSASTNTGVVPVLENADGGDVQGPSCRHADVLGRQVHHASPCGDGVHGLQASVREDGGGRGSRGRGRSLLGGFSAELAGRQDVERRWEETNSPRYLHVDGDVGCDLWVSY